MESNKKGDIRISGSGTVSGGEYNEIHVSGSASISGGVVCERLAVSGSAHIHGSVKAESASVSGSANMDGPFEGGELKVSGSAHISGAMKARRIKVSGSIHAGGSVEAEELTASGGFELNGDCSAESVRLSGVCHIDGMLNADNVDFRLYHNKTTVREIGGGTISIREGHDFSHGFFRTILGRQILLETGSIEGDDITLEYTKAAVVRGARVHIGVGCEIGTVEYRESYEKADGSTVQNEKKI